MAKRTKQTQIPGTEPFSTPALEEAAEDYLDKRNAWQGAHQPMMLAKTLLMAEMATEKIVTFEFNRDGVDYVVELTAAETVSVKTKKKPASNGEA